MKSKKTKINSKHLSVFSFIVIAVLVIIKLAQPELYDKIAESYLPPANNINDSDSNVNEFNNGLCAGKQTCVAKVVKIIDGDTVEISTGEKVRYIGVDTPETKHPIKKVQCFGKEASEKNKELVEGKEVKLEKDVSDKDKYERLLRYIYLPAGQVSVDDLLVNDFLARNGFAHAATFPPDVKFSQQFLEAEKEARVKKLGLWAPGVCP